MSDKEEGLYGKYRVERVDGKPMPAGCIVMEWKDPSARRAIRTFSDCVKKAGYLQLSDDLDKRLEAYSEDPGHYDSAMEFISELPATWLPALLIHMIKTAYSKRVFLQGKATRFLRDNLQGEA